MEYQEMVSKILEVTPITEDEIFEYESSPHKDQFNAAFKFYNETISLNNHFGISPHLLFYYNDYSPNAAAGKVNGHYIMYIHAGTIIHLIRKFRSASIPLSSEYQTFEGLIDTSISNLMYDFALHFTFYHELGHLVQKSDLLEKNLYERPNNNDEFSIERHVLELDADTFSCLCLGTHVLQYARQQFDNDVIAHNIRRLIVVACGSAFLYLLSFHTNTLPIYYEDYTHPHPVIRITCIVFHIVGYCNQSLKESGLELNIKEIINEAMSFAHSISFDGNEISIIEQYQGVIGQEADNIEAYLRKTRSIQEADTTLSAFKWNQQVLRRNL